MALKIKGKLKVLVIFDTIITFFSSYNMQVLYSFTGTDSNQLSIKEGDTIVWNDGELSDDWILCSHLSKASISYFV